MTCGNDQLRCSGTIEALGLIASSTLSLIAVKSILFALIEEQGAGSVTSEIAVGHDSTESKSGTDV